LCERGVGGGCSHIGVPKRDEEKKKRNVVEKKMGKKGTRSVHRLSP